MIPQFKEIWIQALKELSSGVVMRAKDLRIPLAKHFGLTEEEMNAWYPSGNGEIFLDRISWALSFFGAFAFIVTLTNSFICSSVHEESIDKPFSLIL